ncbi:MAG TPA: hypothetical protein VF298_08815 [Bacteroidales bacterium]
MKKISLPKTSAIHCFAILIIILVFGCSKQTKSRIPGLTNVSNVVIIAPSDTGSLTVAEKNDLSSLKTVLNVSGIRFTVIPVRNVPTIKLSEFNIIIVPFAASKTLNDAALGSVLQAVKSGSNLLTDGVSPLTGLLGIKLQPKTVNITRIRDTHFSNNTLYWTTPCDAQTIDNADRNDSVLAFDETTHQPIAVSGTFGKGRFVSLSPLFDPNTKKGYSRFPFLIEWLQSYLGLARIAERQVVEMYFDPGNRKDPQIPIDSLARMWRERKIKRVYAAGWYYDGAYDYTPLFKACHSNGIQVYCWLETPEVNDLMWKQHPEWREKTATGRDANIDWRRLMNLADENCRKQVFKELGEFLMKYDWDGVNFAEMYFEPSPLGFEDPDNFSPMNSTVRSEFEQLSGFDPVQLFNPQNANYWKTNKISWRKFADYRKELAYRIKGQFLDFLTTIKNRKTDFDVMLTVLDVSLQPAESDAIGESTEHTLALYRKYNITLQIEDPSDCWGTGPERYAQLGKLYRKTVKEENRLVFDCNVVGSHEQGFGGFPSEKPSGEEIRQITYNMSLYKIRPAFYSEDAVNANDFKNISTVLAREASITEVHVNEWKINTPYMITVNTGRSGLGLKLDQKNWFAGDNGQVIIPQGKHILSFDALQSPISTIGLKNISGELKWAKFSENELEFAYTEEVTSCYAIFDTKPITIYIDGKKVDIFPFGDKEFVLKLPRGMHKVKVTCKAAKL